MRALLADTFYWIALTDPNDTAHQDALAMTAERAAAPLITTDEVLSEYLAFFANATKALRREAGGIVRDLLESPALGVAAQSRESFLSGLALYTARPDKGYSLTDCISNADNASRGAQRGVDQRPTLRAGGLPSAIPLGKEVCSWLHRMPLK
jgi:predicted nucleic acid-binding protein